MILSVIGSFTTQTLNKWAITIAQPREGSNTCYIKVIMLCVCTIVLCVVHLTSGNFVTKGVKTILTPNKYDFKHEPIDVSDITFFTFDVKTCHDGHIQLSKTAGNTDVDTYEILLQGWNNGPKTSAIRDKKQGKLEVFHNGQIVYCDSTTSFWISWAGGNIEVGRGQVYGTDRFLHWRDQSPHPVNALQFTSGFGGSGTWTYKTPLKIISTPNDYNFKHTPIDVSGRTFITFDVKTCHDGHVQLSKTAGNTNVDTYEILLQGWNNGPKTSAIRDKKQGKLEVFHNGPIVHCDATLSFWISWAGGYIEVGKGRVYGRDTFLQWYDPSPHPVNAVQFTSGFGASGRWTIQL
ncbi:unnamed protein product [Owenia fusiformis]|uniref:Farnesoic acid O-methyl transferase domain-containing protein n=1 Tax=Owenia fusiformis TaxID=6347 RepID=A0A8S4NRB4_OWEFU|nr:unnamed protein product [Owenia fusiformis]